MNKPVVISYETNPNHPGVKRFINSLQKFGWNYELIVESPWRGFGRRLKKVVEVARGLNMKFSHCIHLDARDNLMQGPPEEFVAPEVPLLLAGEENLWPGSVKVSRADYPKGTSIWQFAHSQFVLNLDNCDLMATDTIADIKDDQLHCHELFFANSRDTVKIDYDCKYIQSLAFCHPWTNYFTIKNNRVRNLKTNNLPLVCHGNGGTDMTWVPGYN